MRIIGGKYRGKKLFSPDSDAVRPTSDRAREALFNILNSMLEKPLSEYTFLDVFSGTGAIALEALSRGAAQVGLIDINPKNLQKNTALFPLEKDKIKVIKADVAHLPQASEQYDLLFMDAPYQKGLSEVALSALDAQNWLVAGALCMVEVEKTEQINVPACYQVLNERMYGLAKIIFMTYKPSKK